MIGTESLEPLPFIEGIVYGEGPRWRDGQLWFTDGPAGKVYSADESGGLRVEAEVEHASGLGWLPDGTLVVSALFEPTIHHVDTGGNIAATHDLSDLGWSTNDLLVTADGRTYVDVYRRPGTANDGAIGFVDDAGRAQLVATGIDVPNGLALLPDGSTLVVSETNGGILAFAAEPDGSLGSPSVFADLGVERNPDGLCVDVDGGVWVGCYSTGEFLRVVAGGAVTRRVEIDRGWAIAPALGGPDGRTLYMVVDDTTHEGLLKGESTGWIMQARVDVPGARSP